MAGTALVTGVSSFAGAHLGRQLVDEGWTVAGLTRTRSSGIDAVSEHKIDIADRDALAELIGDIKPDVVFHLAAIVDTVETPSVTELYRVNTVGTAAVADAIAAAAPSSRLVFTSSAFVYGHTAPDEQPILEPLPLRALTPYGASKVAAEAIVEQFVRAGGDAVIARAFQHTGAGHVGAYALADWGQQVAEIAAGRRDPVVTVGNLEVERDYLDVRDVASAYMALAEHGSPGEAYNVSSGDPVTMRALLEGLIAAFGAEVTIETDPSRMRKVDQQQFYGDPAKLIAATGWQRRYSQDEMLEQLAGWWRERIASPAG